MEDFFKYLTASKDDEEWGIYLTVAGRAEISKRSSEYPLKDPGHPNGYDFRWEKGRVLNEYQIHYFTEGEGVLENSFGKFRIKQGAIMITYPGVWHRFKPSTKVGWIENYVGFKGRIADSFLSGIWFSMNKPVINSGIHEELIDTYYKIFDLVKEEKPNFQFIASGLIVKLLGYIVSFQKQVDFQGKFIQSVIEDARFILRENLEKDISFEKIAADHHVGYSYFRKMFKKYTGISPKKYLIQLKIMRAKELLTNSSLTIKEIAFKSGFQSGFYFSRIFKEKTGVNPSDLRRL